MIDIKLKILTRFKIIFILFLMSIMLFNCSLFRKPDIEIAGSSCYGILENHYFNKPMQKRKDNFKTQNLDRQYAIYMCGKLFIHPPPNYLSDVFALGGEKTKIYLQKKISTLKIKSGYKLMVVVDVLSSMQFINTYDVKNDKKLLELIDERVNEINDKVSYKDMIQRMIADIKGYY